MELGGGGGGGVLKREITIYHKYEFYLVFTILFIF